MEYHGFSGAWDSKARVFVFSSKDERDRWQIETYGRVKNGWREPDDPDDGRPGISRHRCQCKGCRERKAGDWTDRMEQATYEAAVAGNPRREGEGPFAYIRRISELVTQEREAGAQSMPHVRQSRRERDAALLRLRFQSGQIGQRT